MSMRQARLATRALPRAYGQNPEGESLPILAPTLGMNTRDGVASLDAREARSIRNMIAENGRLVIRKGKTPHQEIELVDGIGSMFTHEGVSTNFLLAAAGGEIWNVTGTPDQLTSATYSLNVWSMAQFNDTTIGVNGTDDPWAFDGVSVGASGLSGSGLTIANLRTIHVVGVRLWFTEEGSADVWYLQPNAITGVLTKFQLSQVTKGGYCVGVYGYNASTIFVMSSGEVLEYAGDPGVGGGFRISNRLTMPRPVGYNPGFEVTGDLILMTAGGPLPYGAVAQGIAFDSTALQAWGKIAPSWVTDFEQSGAIAGWNASFFAGLVILNVQVDLTTSKQWIFNTRTQAWSFFDGLNGYEFAEVNGTLYFGDKVTGQIWAYMGGTDNEGIIQATVRHGFTYPFQRRVNGQFTLARINVQATGLVTGQVQVDVDYKTAGITAPEFPLATSGSGPWDGPWDGPWGEDGEAILRWSSVKGFGRAVAPVVQFNSQADDLQYFATDVVVAPATGITG